MKKWKIAGINFDHMHMGDNLRVAFEHPDVELVGISDEKPERMAAAVKNFKLPQDRVFTDYRQCLEKTRPDLVLLCPATAEHGKWTKNIAPFGVNVVVEKPFAATLQEADEMIAAMKPTGKMLAINWPLRWSPTCVTAKRLIDEGLVGDVLEFHHYGGNRGPLYHTADKIDVDDETVNKQKPTSWWYKKAHGGGSLLDYAGYGTTIGTWFQNGRAPIEVTCVVDEPPGLEVDEHAVIVMRYAHGLSKSETRWGTFTDPWTHQPQPKCGFVIVGTKGTIGAFDYSKTLRVQTKQKPEGYDHPVDTLKAPEQNIAQYMVDRLARDLPVDGPLSVAMSRTGQQIVDTAVLSAKEKRTMKLLG